jgi:hypothetical protein
MAHALQILDRATQDRYGTARVSKRPTDESAACLRARYRAAACPNVVWFDLVTMSYAYQS